MTSRPLAAHVQAALAAHAIQRKATPAAARQPAPHVRAAIGRSAAGAPPAHPAGGAPTVVLPKSTSAPPAARSPRVQAPKVIQRASQSSGVTWEKLLPIIKRMKGDGSPQRTENTLPEATKDELELLASELGMSPPGGDYEVGATLSGAQLEHAQEISAAYSGIIAIVVNLVQTDDEGFNALSQSGFLKRLADIQPGLCNMQTAKELLECLAMIRKR